MRRLWLRLNGWQRLTQTPYWVEYEHRCGRRERGAQWDALLDRAERHVCPRI